MIGQTARRQVDTSISKPDLDFGKQNFARFLLGPNEQMASY